MTRFHYNMNISRCLIGNYLEFCQSKGKTFHNFFQHAFTLGENTGNWTKRRLLSSCITCVHKYTLRPKFMLFVWAIVTGKTHVIQAVAYWSPCPLPEICSVQNFAKRKTLKYGVFSTNLFLF